MPARKGYSREAFRENIALFEREGYTRVEALARAYKVAREAYFRRYPGGVLPQWLAYPGGKRTRRANPVPASKRVQLREAGELYQDFSGHDPQVVARLEKPEYPDVVLSVGECDGILYTTVRDGRTEKYIHRFRKKSRPLLAVSSDGTQLYLLGGAYKFTDRGITDK